MSYSQTEDLQESVNNGHFPWRLDYKQVIINFLSDKGEKAENGELVAFAGDGEKCSGNYKTGNSIYTLELFKPFIAVNKADGKSVKLCDVDNEITHQISIEFDKENTDIISLYLVVPSGNFKSEFIHYETYNLAEYQFN